MNILSPTNNKILLQNYKFRNTNTIHSHVFTANIYLLENLENQVGPSS